LSCASAGEGHILQKSARWYPLSRRIRNLKAALAKLDPQPEPVVEPLPPPTRWVNSTIGQRKRGSRR